MNIFNLFVLQWTDIVDIGILSLLIYYLIILLQGTKSFQILLGLGGVLFLYYFAVFFELRSILWGFQNIFQYTVILLVIIFQTDIRNALANFGKGGGFQKESDYSKCLNSIMEAVTFATRDKTGMMIAFEKKIQLGEYIKTGEKLMAIVSTPLISSIFSKKAALHDGAIIINSKYLLVAASCIFPLSTQINFNNSFGTRHRAAMGLSELTDAVIITISEQNGNVSIFYQGKVDLNLSIVKTRQLMEKYLTDKN